MSLPASVQQLVDAIAHGRLTGAAIAPAIRDAGGRDFVLFAAIRELAAGGGGGSASFSSLTGQPQDNAPLAAILDAPKDKPLSAGIYVATVADMNGAILTDGAAGTDATQINLPTFAAAFAHGGIIRIGATRDLNSGGGCAISVYPDSGDQSPNRMKLGPNAALFSLYSTDVSYLELTPQVIDSVNYWVANNFTGFWQDRD